MYSLVSHKTLVVNRKDRLCACESYESIDIKKIIKKIKTNCTNKTGKKALTPQYENDYKLKICHFHGLKKTK